MNEKDRKEVPSTSADNGISTSSNVKRPARSSKICKKCSRSVKNLSRHQQEVHGMSKMRRKLDGYFTGEKKTPNRRVKFCPTRHVRGPRRQFSSWINICKVAFTILNQKRQHM